MSPFDEPGLWLSAWGEHVAAFSRQCAAPDMDRDFCLPRRGLFPILWLRRSLGVWGGEGGNLALAASHGI